MKKKSNEREYGNLQEEKFFNFISTLTLSLYGKIFILLTQNVYQNLFNCYITWSFGFG